MENNSEYVIRNKRLNNYLYSLGFNSKRIPSKTENGEFVYLFSDSELLQRAISFYTEFKKQMY